MIHKRLPVRKNREPFYPVNSVQWGRRGHSLHFGLRAMQISRPKRTIRWQKSELSSGGGWPGADTPLFPGPFPGSAPDGRRFVCSEYRRPHCQERRTDHPTKDLRSCAPRREAEAVPPLFRVPYCHNRISASGRPGQYPGPCACKIRRSVPVLPHVQWALAPSFPV